MSETSRLQQQLPGHCRRAQGRVQHLLKVRRITFGAQSKGEQEQSGLCFHGEAGLVQWEVEGASIIPGGGVELTMAASLPESQLRIGRVFDLKPGSHTVKCTETITNLTGFQRAGGRAQHVTIGSEWLQSAGGCRFACNADRGMTWPDEVDDGTWKQATEFNYPFVPKKKSGSVNGAADEGGGGAEGGGDEKDSDWRTYPREPKKGTCAPCAWSRPPTTVGSAATTKRTTSL